MDEKSIFADCLTRSGESVRSEGVKRVEFESSEKYQSHQNSHLNVIGDYAENVWQCMVVK